MRKKPFILSVFALATTAIFGQLPDELIPGDGRFEPNMGQIVDLEGNRIPSALYQSSEVGALMMIQNDGASYIFRTDNYIINDENRIEHNGDQDYIERIDLNFLGFNNSAIYTGDKLKSGITNYLNLGSNNVTDVPSFGALEVSSFYPGIDLYLKHVNGLIAYQFVIQPHVDPSIIQLAFEGAKEVKVNELGLKAKGELGELRFQNPMLFTAGSLVPQVVKFTQSTTNINLSGVQASPLEQIVVIAREGVGIERLFTTEFSETKWSTYFGHSLRDEAVNTYISADNNLIVSGHTNSRNFPTQNGYNEIYNLCSTPEGTMTMDGFIQKFDPNRSLVFSTYMGACGTDVVNDAISKNGQSEVFFAMHTTSTKDFPAIISPMGSYSSSTPSNLMIGSLNSQGNQILWSTFIGNTYQSIIYDLNFDNNGDLFAVGLTNGDDIPFTQKPGAYFNNINGYFPGYRSEGLILQFNGNTKSLIWCTYYGGVEEEIITAVDFDGQNNMIISGFTKSQILPFPQNSAVDYQYHKGNEDAFVQKFSSNGALDWGTFFGTSGRETNIYGGNMAVDFQGNIYLTGTTPKPHDMVADRKYTAHLETGESFLYPHEIYVTKFSPTGKIDWSHLYGGTGLDESAGIDVDHHGTVIVAGATSSLDFLTTPRADGFYSPHTLPDSRALKEYEFYDGFILQFDTDGTLDFSTCFGNNEFDKPSALAGHINPISGRFDELCTSGTTFSNAFNPLYRGNSNAFFQGSNYGGYDQFISNFKLKSKRFVPIDKSLRVNENRNELILWGNLISKSLEFEISGESEGLATVTIINHLGQMVSSNRITLATNKNNISTSELAEGMYFLIVNKNGQEYSKKFIKH